MRIHLALTPRDDCAARSNPDARVGGEVLPSLLLIEKHFLFGFFRRVSQNDGPRDRENPPLFGRFGIGGSELPANPQTANGGACPSLFWTKAEVSFLKLFLDSPPEGDQ